MFTVVLYTHCDLADPPFRACFDVLSAAISHSASTEMVAPHRIVVTSEPQDVPRYWQNVVAVGDRGHHDCYTKIIAGCEAAKHDIVFLAEHDVLYPQGYFDASPESDDAFYYNSHVWTLSLAGAWPTPRRWLTSNCRASRELLLDQFRDRLALVNSGGRVVWDEPGRNDGDIAEARWLTQDCPEPTVDVRYGGNLTGMRYSKGAPAAVIPGWGRAGRLWSSLGLVPAKVETPEKPQPQRGRVQDVRGDHDRRFV